MTSLSTHLNDRELWKIDNRIVKTESIVQTAKVDKEGYWCTTVSAAVLVL